MRLYSKKGSTVCKNVLRCWKIKGHCVLGEAFSYRLRLTLDAEGGLQFFLVLSSVNKEVLYDVGYLLHCTHLT